MNTNRPSIFSTPWIADGLRVFLPSCLALAVLAGCGPTDRETHVSSPAPVAPSLEEQLRGADPAALAKAVYDSGNPFRGAQLFHQPGLACAKCHLPGDGQPARGPSLETLSPPPGDRELIAGVLEPSRVIRAGFETQVVTTHDGRTLTGLLSRESDQLLVLVDIAQLGLSHDIPKNEIESRSVSAVSAMPAGLVNQLQSRQDFLDLMAYVFDVVRQGRQRRLELTPDETLLTPPVAEYENNLDHRGMLRELGGENFRRGAAIYRRICFNCHGDEKSDGSIILANKKFASIKFQYGADPLRMYRTITHGIGQMPPQAYLTPQQRYDVIHYLREHFLRRHNASQYVPIDASYLASVPSGTERGPSAPPSDPWTRANYGPSLTTTFLLPQPIGDDKAHSITRLGPDGSALNFISVPKGIAIRLDDGPGGVSQGRQWLLFEHDSLSAVAAWTDRFIDGNAIAFNGALVDGPAIAGTPLYTMPLAPGWADPTSGTFDDPRPRDRVLHQPYGPLPPSRGRYRGHYHHGARVVLAYDIGDTQVLESPGLETPLEGHAVFSRTLEVGPSPLALAMRVAPRDVSVTLVAADGASIVADGPLHTLRLPPSSGRRVLRILISAATQSKLDAFAARLPPAKSPAVLTTGGAPRWPQALETAVRRSTSSNPFAVDVLSPPTKTPWDCQLRFTALDFFADGDSLAAATFDGDIWRVTGLEADTLQWRRIASGLYQPMGIKIVENQVFVGCRDQIVVLRDLNGDGETDFYQNFNSDHQLTEHFHEFATGLQTDAQGNFYYARGARLDQGAVPHDGTVVRVSPDGTRSEPLVTGLREPNGVWTDPDGACFVTDQDGPWVPGNALYKIVPGAFYGYNKGYHGARDTSDAAVEPPICWISPAFDRSPAEPIRVPEHTWGTLEGALLSLSYGNGRILVSAYERSGNRLQGGISALPLGPFPTGLARGRFHPRTGALYVAGLFVWASTQTEAGGLFRVRHTGQPFCLPVGFHSHDDGLSLRFSQTLDPARPLVPNDFHVNAWSLRRSADYGSLPHDMRSCPVESAELSGDGQTVRLRIDALAPGPCYSVNYFVQTLEGERVSGQFNCTLHSPPSTP